MLGSSQDPDSSLDQRTAAKLLGVVASGGPTGDVKTTPRSQQDVLLRSPQSKVQVMLLVLEQYSRVLRSVQGAG